MGSYRSRKQYRHRGRGRYRAHNSGRERALKHIAEAKALTRELGGTDTDVKEYFFSLSDGELQPIFNEYGVRYGSSARSYAEQTISKWRSGQTHMSGMVAERLFGLLPPRMPLSKKYELVENLWKHLGPSSNTTFTVGYTASIDDVVGEITAHTERVITEFRMPDSLERRFSWISSGDVDVKQKLLNHLQSIERKTLLEGVRMNVPEMQAHLNSPDGQYSKSATQEFQVGKHTIRLEFEPRAEGIFVGSIRDSRPSRQNRSTDPDLSWIIWVAVAITLFIIFGN